MHLGHHTITWGGVVGDATGVTSVKDLYYRAAGSMEQAFRDIAAAGYTGTEMFDGNLVDLGPEKVRDLLAETGLSLVSVYTGANFIYDEILPDELHRVQRACGLAKAAGAERLVVGGGARRGERDDRPGLRPARPRSRPGRRPGGGRRAVSDVPPAPDDHRRVARPSWNACCRRPGSASAPTPPTSPQAAATRPR